MITAMKVGRSMQRALVLTLAVWLTTSLSLAQSWEDSDVGAPPDVGSPEDSSLNAQPAPRPVPAPASDPNQYTDTDPSALTEFRPTLDAHGRWVDDPTYGVVWVPHESAVGKDFAPYVTNGHWALAEDGQWMWVSNYPFGWVVFHYGRWVWISNTGWAWIPGRQYAHAWVVWRVPTSDYAYVGWAPMPPSYVWFGGSAVTLWFTAPAPYVFCHSHYLFHHHVHHYIVHDHARVRYIAGRTRVYRPASARYAASPTLRDARVPPRSAPRQRVPADPRAVAAARRTTAASVPVPGRRFTSTRNLGSSYSAAPRPATPAPGTAYSRATPRQPALVGRSAAPVTQGAAAPAPARPVHSFVAPSPQPARALPSQPARAVPSQPARAVPSQPARAAAPAHTPRQVERAPVRNWSTGSSRPSSPPPASWSAAPSRSWSSGPSRSWSPSPSRSFSAPSRSHSAPSRAAPSRRR